MCGPWHYGGSDSDNGQTGRKLVIDFYGPRLPICGGALSGKCFGFIDRLAAYAAGQAAVTAVVNGALSCQVTLVYAPWRQAPLEIICDLQGGPPLLKRDWFFYDRMKCRYDPLSYIHLLSDSRHFFDLSFPWNQPADPV